MSMKFRRLAHWAEENPTKAILLVVLLAEVTIVGLAILDSRAFRRSLAARVTF